MKQRAFTLVHPRPTFAGLLFVLLAMWYAASSQNNAAAYLLLFTLGGVFLISILQTVRNLAGLKLRSESVKPGFAGDEVSLPVEIINQSRAARYGLSLRVPILSTDHAGVDHVAPGRASRVMLRFPSGARGEHQIGNLCLTSVYPLGFMRARKWLPSQQRYLVYPRPAGDPNLPVDRERSAEKKVGVRTGEGGDFVGLRAYVPGESQRHIDWKAVARGQPFMTKQYDAEPSGLLYLDFASIPRGGPEERLSQLALWVIEAERVRRPYGLRLPGAGITPSLGEAHFHRCLRALALFK